MIVSMNTTESTPNVSSFLFDLHTTKVEGM